MNILPVDIRFAKTRDDATFPKYAHRFDAGLDLITPETLVLKPGIPTFVDIGIAIELPNGYVGDVRSRSGLTKRGITACGGLGTIDSTYRGSIGVTLTWALSIETLLTCINKCKTLEEDLFHTLSSESITIEKGSKIAQLVITPVIEAAVIKVSYSEFTKTDRGTGGFGSTGM